VRRTAVNAAAAAFIVLAIVGAVSDVPPFVCGMRALAGAGITYVLVTVAGRLAISILVSIIRGSGPRSAQIKDQTGEHAD